MIQLESICKTYGSGEGRVCVLKDVSLCVKAGELCAIMGPSGSGKSTLLNILGLLDQPTSGRYNLEGTDIQNADANTLADLRNEKIGFIFQSFHLLPRLSALDNVAHPLLYQGLGKAERRKRAATQLKQVGLKDRAHHRPDELSGGQHQRVAIARALVGSPSLILADEPTGNLDSASATEIMDLIKQLNSSLGVTTIIITHDPVIAQQCNRCISVLDGNVSG